MAKSSVDPIPYIVNSIVQINESNFVDTFPLWKEEVDALLALCELPEISKFNGEEAQSISSLDDRKIRGIVNMAMARDIRTRIAPGGPLTGKTHQTAQELWGALEKHYKKLANIRLQTQAGPKPTSVPAFYKANDSTLPIAGADLTRQHESHQSGNSFF